MDATGSRPEKPSWEKRIRGRDSQSEKPARQLHTQDSYSEKHPEQIHNRESYFEKLPEQIAGENSYSEKPREPFHSEDSYSERHPEQKHNRESYFEKLPEQIDGDNSYSEKPMEPLHTEDSPFEKLPEQMDDENSYSEKPTELLHTGDSYFKMHPEQIHNFDFYSENPTEPLNTEDSYSERHPEQIHNRESYFEKLPEQIDGENSYSEKPTEPLHTDDSFSERHPEQIHNRESYFEKLPEQIDGENSYSEKPTEPFHTGDSDSDRHPEPIHNCDFYFEKLHEQIDGENSYSEKPTEPLHTEDSYSERHPEQIHNRDFYLEKLPGQIDSENSYSEKPTEHFHTGDSYSERHPEQIHNSDFYSEKPTEPLHTEDSYSEELPEKIHNQESSFEKLPEQIDGENSYSEKPTESLHTEDSYSEWHPEQIHNRESYFEKLPEQIAGENSYSEKPTEQFHTEDSYSERHPEQMDSMGSSCPNLTAAHLRTEDSSSEKVPAQIRNEDSHGENVAEQICTESSPLVRLPEQVRNGDFDGRERATPPHADTRDSRRPKPPQEMRAAAHSSSEKPPEDRHRPDSDSATPTEQTRAEDSSAESAVERGHGADSFSENTRREKPDERRRADVSVRERLPKETDAGVERSRPGDSLPRRRHGEKASRQTCSEAFHADDERKSPHADSPQGLASFRSSFGGMLLRSGVVALPGSRDRNGRALLTVDAGAGAVWSHPECRGGELLRLMRYYVSTLGSRHMTPLTSRARVQEEVPGRVGRVLALMDEDSDSALRVDPPAQVEVVTSLECLARHVDAHQLPPELGGSYRFSHGDWLAFRSRVEQLGRQCEDVIELLRKNIAIMEDTRLPDTQQEAERQLSVYRELMGEVLADGRLARLQREGVASLSLLLRERGGPSEERRARASAAFAQVSSWMEGEGEPRLRRLDRSEDSPEALRRNFEDFRSSARARLEEGEAALRRLERWRDAGPSDLRAHWLRVGSLRAQLEDFRRRIAAAERNVRKRLALDRFLDHACGRAVESRHRLAAEGDAPAEERRAALDEHRRRHPPIAEAAFREMTSLANELRDERGARRLSFARAAFDEKMADARPRSSSVSAETLPAAGRFDRPAAPQACRSGPSAARGPSEPARRGNTGVFIRGLEVSGAEAGRRSLRAGTESSPAEGDGRKLRHIVEEMVTTEREYVRSLRYVIAHYFPEMERADLPQDLRGKRSVVFGNLEKLLDFHAHIFLQELEACWKHPLRVAHCFLRHQEQFGLYALYSKNKPKSDALLASRGLAFFKRKQRELGDRMDLCSYLLKPVQRMSKYALLLDDLIKEAGAAQEAERTSLRTALAAVKFQLRHGNDLLAMDAIRRCDVDLKEQGRLLRQDRFTVWSGRRKRDRRVFLFDELLLLSKAKKMDGGLDVFEYKRSFKTSDLGLTESKGDDGLRFEIWFRRRTAKNQTLTLQAASADVKCAWTRELAAILWTQATRNKEARLKEMLSMGVGDKPYLDIRPSAAAISDRAVRDVARIRGARMRASIAVSASDCAAPFSSDPSSAGLLGSLDLHVMRSRTSGGDVEEDELERDTASQRSVTTDSSGSSSRCQSGSTGSDSGCVSSTPRDPSSASSGSSHKAGAAPVGGPTTSV
ncbi:puratrophin-1 [Hippocampus comes]|uniref:puratrophin-1 n=1 Tax=Hippocampus comes TaxID=109280 RepID=UPI00094F072F|nr:PREDICTED: puratrophin-1-like [Hippocampus comes]